MTEEIDTCVSCRNLEQVMPTSYRTPTEEGLHLHRSRCKILNIPIKSGEHNCPHYEYNDDWRI